MTEVQLGECFKVNQYGLQRSQYHATVSDGDMARIVALACEGRVWQRHWGIKLDDKGRVVEVRAPHVPPPCYAWLGDYNTGILTEQSVRGMMESLRGDKGLAEQYVLTEEGNLSPIN